MDPCSEEEYYYKLDTLMLKACQQVRKVFTNRWKTETGEDWIDDKEHVTKFLNGHGVRVLQKAEPFQLKVLQRSQGVQEWDIQLLFLILNNFGRNDKNKPETDAVYFLKELRNALAHHNTKKITRAEYEGKLADLKRNLKTLGMKNKAIIKMVKKVEDASSLRAAEAVAKLYRQAAVFRKKRQFEKALACFSEAVDMPSLSPEDRQVAFENRAECWLASVKNVVSDADKCERALLDAKRALELKDGSWKAHYLAAKCYHQKNDLSQAQHHYDRSLAISPVEEQVRRDYETCCVSATMQNNQCHQDPGSLPLNFQERLAQVQRDTGLLMNKKEYARYTRLTGKRWKGQDQVLEGHRHFYGWNGPENFAEAFKCYAKAAAGNNPEGMYHLGLCYHHGHGVPQDIQQALKIYREVAAMDPGTQGTFTPLQYNFGVTNAEHVIGVFYHHGVVVERDYGQAVQWYQKAMEHGAARAAANLGLLYLRGDGMSLDEKMGMYCLKLALNLIDDEKDKATVSSLYFWYKHHLEPERAETMWRLGRHMGSFLFDRMTDAQFLHEIGTAKSQRKDREPEVLEFERTHNLSTKGLTFKERKDRRTRYVCPSLEKARKLFQDTMKTYDGEGNAWGEKVGPLTEEKIAVIRTKAKEGSITASRIMTTLTSASKMNGMLGI